LKEKEMPETRIPNPETRLPEADLSFGGLLRLVMEGGRLSRGESHRAFGEIMEGRWTGAQVSAFVVALAMRGECADEIAGAALAMRERVAVIDAGGMDVIDTCGTGGTGLSTFNVSTAAAIVAAGAGARVAKHGNRTATRASGSADVLAALGVNIDAGPAAVTRCLKEAGVCFCFAQKCHPAMRHAAPVRKELGVRTIFNLLGPLTNPAGARRQLMGVYREDLTATVAAVLGSLGSVHAMVVHAADGLDEISTLGPTTISEFRNGALATRTVSPADFGLPVARLADISASSPEQSADVIREVLSGQEGPARDITILNAGAALNVAGLAESIEQGMTLARQAIDGGSAAVALEKLIDASNS
jgi:anthranilate phosphoribosyltransferase